MNNGMKNDIWFLENVGTKAKVFLNNGRFTIGREESNDIRIVSSSGESNWCSNLHCVLTLSKDHVWLCNASEQPEKQTYIRDKKIHNQQLEEGDTISLVETSVRKENKSIYEKLSFILRKICVVPSWLRNLVQGDILASISTAVGQASANSMNIKISKFYDEIDGNQNVKSPDDISIDSITIVVENLASTNSTASVVSEQNSTPECTKHVSTSNNITTKEITNLDSNQNVLHNVSESLPSVEHSKNQSLSTQKKRIAHTPKEPNSNGTLLKNHELAKKRKLNFQEKPTNVHCKPQAPHLIPSVPSKELSMINFSSFPSPPYEDAIDESVDHFSSFINTVINWNAKEIMNKINASKAFWTNLAPIPTHTFQNVINHEQIQTNLLKCHTWHGLNKNFKELKTPADLHIDKISSSPTKGNTGHLIYDCYASGSLNIRKNHVIIVKVTISSSSMVEHFLGFIREFEKKGATQIMFKLEVGMEHRDNVRTTSKAVIVAHQNIDSYVGQFNAIFDARKSNLFNQLIDPFALTNRRSGNEIARNNTNKQLERKNYINSLSHEQLNVCSNIFHSTVDAMFYEQSSVKIINGGPGSGKSRLLIEIIGLFVKAEHICQKRGKLKILVTGPSNDVVDALARNLEKYRNHQNIDAELKSKLKFVRYGDEESLTHEYPDMEQFLSHHKQRKPIDMQAENIVFASVSVLHKLVKLTQNYDVILFDDASECSEMHSTLALCFSPSAFLMFGDRLRKPKDDLDLEMKYKKTMNQSMFQRLLNVGHHVLHLKQTVRFSSSVLNFMNEVFYNRVLQPSGIHTHGNINGFRLFYGVKDDSVYYLLRQMMHLFQPRHVKYSLILPPNIYPKDLEKNVGAFELNKEHIATSWNNTSITKESDITIIWLNESINDRFEYKYRLTSLLPVLTHTKKAIVFIAGHAVFQNHASLRIIYDYAHRNGYLICSNDGHFLSLEEIRNLMQT